MNIELRPRKEKLKIKDPMTGEILKEKPLFPEGVCVYVNGFATAYCDFPGGPCNIIRGGMEPVREEIEAALQDHFSKQCKPPACTMGEDEDDRPSDDVPQPA